MRRNSSPRWNVGAILCLLMLAISIGCAKPRSVLPDCAIERPNSGVLQEQIHEAERAEFSKEGPLLPHTYEWIKRLDRDLGLFGDPE